MGIGVLLKRDGQEFAITENDYEINPGDVLGDDYWLTNSPTYQDMNRGAVSWSDFASLFNLTVESNLADIKSAIMTMNNITEHLSLQPGKKLFCSFLKKLPVRDHHFTPFPREVSHVNLDMIIVNKAEVGNRYRFDVLEKMKLSDFSMISEIIKTKTIHDAAGEKDGVYKISVPALGMIPEISNTWATWDQISLIKKLNPGLRIHTGVLFAQSEQNWREPIVTHPVLSKLLPTRNLKKSERDIFERLLKRFLMNIPHPSDTHPYSLMFRGQAWAKAFVMAHELQREGYKIIQLNHEEIWCTI